MIRNGAHIAKGGINYAEHFGDAPFDDITEVFIVDVVVLLPNRPLSAFLQFILTISAGPGRNVCQDRCAGLRALRTF